jgi:AraC family transcriptional regulator
MLENQSGFEQSCLCRYSDVLFRPHVLTSYDTDWSSLSSCLDGGLSPYHVRQVIEHINNHLDGDLELERLAAIVQLSQYHFSRAFKRSTGMSPHQYVIQQRVERAKQLLRQGEMSICEIAIRCGFTHQSHLTRHFRRLMGVTPKVFQKW